MSSGTVLDSSRLRLLLARRAQVSAGSVHANIVGEHGDTEFALWSEARIGPVPVREWRAKGQEPFGTEELERITHDVRNAAYRVIEGKGATNFAIGLAGARIIEAVLGDQHAILPVSTVHDGYKGFSGVAFSMPSIIDGGGVNTVLDVAISDEEQRLLEASAEALQSAQATLGL
jgi:L-lactate dehydrogenase